MQWGDFSFDLLKLSLERKNTLLQTEHVTLNLRNDVRDISAGAVLLLKYIIQRVKS